MADEDKDKAEKVAAAKKRYEQLKKQKAKETKKGGKKKDDKAAAEATTEDKAEDAAPTDDTPAAEEDKPTESVEPQTGEEEASESPEPQRQASASQQSKKRSESFRQGAPSPATDSKAGAEVQELYRKQAARIEELEKENTAFKELQEDGAARLAKAEEEAESLREGSGDAAALKAKAGEAEKLQSELATVQRQLSQAQQAAKGNARKQLASGPDVTEQLASKTSTIEALELELSNLRNQVNNLKDTAAERETSEQELESRATTAETATESIRQELEALKVSIAFPSDETKAANEDPEALTKRITVLESDLRTANAALETAALRATSLEQKIEALTKLHRDSVTTSQTKDKELDDLRSQLRKQHRPSHVRDASEFDLADDETETGQLQARIRALEAETFDLKRGIWRDRRAEMQPGMDDHEHAPEYEDVDLSGPYSPRGVPRQSSTFQDVISSGISAFTGGQRGQGEGSRPRKPSMGLLSEDGFDEDAFRQAQEEEAKRRIERVKEIKRGLEQWRGWRIDLADMRRGGAGVGRECGPVFEV